MTNSVTVNGVTYTDDSDASTGLGNGGARTRLVPMFSNTIIDIGAKQTAAAASQSAAATSETNAAASAASATSAPGTNATSTTSLTIGTGTQSLTIQTGKSLAVGQRMRLARTSDVTKWMDGGAVSYNSGTGALVMTIASGDTNGSGTFTDWTLSVTGRAGSILGAIDLTTIGPSIRPSLLNDFANSKSLDPRFTLTRATAGGRFNALGLYESMPAGQARFDHHPFTGESLGILREESRRNLTNRSAQFDDAVWTKSNHTVTADATTAPDGTVTADRITCIAGAGSKHTAINYAATAAAYTISIYANAGTTNWIGLAFNTSAQADGAFFDLSAGVVGTVATSTTATIQRCGGGWYRCTITRTLSASTYAMQIEVNAADNQALTYTASGAETLYVWGAQVELGAWASSYIPTAASAVTRDTDLLSTSAIAGFLNSIAAEGNTIQVVADLLAIPTTLNQTLVSLDDGTLANTNSIAFDGSRTDLQLVGSNAGYANQAVVNGTIGDVPAANALFIGAMVIATNNMFAAANGVVSSVDNSCTQPTFTTLRLGARGDGGEGFSGHIKKIAVYPRALSSAEVAALTTK